MTLDYHTYENLLDSHTHLGHMAQRGIALDDLFKNLLERNFGYLLDVGVDEHRFDERCSYFEAFPQLYLAAGIHPTSAGGGLDRIGAIRTQGEHQRVVAIGEIGLDFFHKPVDHVTQQDFFSAQLDLARELNLPVIIHNREADEECFQMLKSADLGRKVVLHCYSSDQVYARKFLDLGCTLSFAGNVTYKSAQSIRDAAKITPKDRILIETDAPFLSPQAQRGKINHPGHLGYLVDFICDLRGEVPKDFIKGVNQNFTKVFQLEERC